MALSVSWVEAEGASAELGDEEKSQKAETVVVDVTPPPTPGPHGPAGPAHGTLLHGVVP